MIPGRYAFVVVTIGVALVALVLVSPGADALIFQRAMGQPSGPIGTPIPSTPNPIGPGLDSSPNPTTSPSCKKTEHVGQCGTNQNLAPISCGGQTCYQTVISYGELTNCVVSAGAGLSNCCAGNCTKTTRTYQCNENQCMEAGTTVTIELPRSYSCQDACSDQN